MKKEIKVCKEDQSIFPENGSLVPAKDRDAFIWTGNRGLTKRELFAIMAMQALLPIYKLPAAVESAVMYADALIEKLESDIESSEEK